MWMLTIKGRNEIRPFMLHWQLPFVIDKTDCYSLIKAIENANDVHTYRCDAFKANFKRGQKRTQAINSFFHHFIFWFAWKNSLHATDRLDRLDRYHECKFVILGKAKLSNHFQVSKTIKIMEKIYFIEIIVDTPMVAGAHLIESLNSCYPSYAITADEIAATEFYSRSYV